MLFFQLTITITTILVFIHATQAVQIPIRKVPGSPRAHSWKARKLLANNTDDQSYGFHNGYNGVYNANITVGGQVFSVQIDTGSSDLWVDTCAANVTLYNTSPSAYDGIVTVDYGDHSDAEGPIIVSEVVFGDFAVPQQAFIQTCNSSALIINMTGLLGFGSSTLNGSWIQDALPKDDSTGYTLLDHAKQQYITTLLSRTPYEEADGGTLTIGEVATGYEDILHRPMVYVLSDWNWAIPVDSMLINGEAVNNTSSATGVDGLQPGQLLMLLDSGTSEAVLPASLVHAIYQDLPGAVFDVDNQVWTVPCDTGKVNVSFVIGNQTYPVHPLDVVVPPYPDDFYPGKLKLQTLPVPICLAAFNCADADLVAFSGVDGILGDTFLRNVYTQFNYGNWSRNGTGTPFVRLLNTTNEGDAWAEYDNLNAQRVQADPGVFNPQHDPQSSAAASAPSDRTYIILFSLGVLLLLDMGGR
ncbi:aspartic peptidase domain-containing protein [Irpex lacteus]|nr:aspartic peptidase domain-containing protein [Irpex lacteus]